MKFWLSCPKFTVLVETDMDGIITYTAAVTAKFTGQSIIALRDWATRFGPVEVEDI